MLIQNTNPVSVAPEQDKVKAGFAREDVWDIGAITALFALSNRMAHLSGMRPNEEFYTLGRGGSGA